jgi:hypothetical protein|eukprot:COSAG01_NODE_661_length_14426_cov_32.272632_7_plen_348_part_00
MGGTTRPPGPNRSERPASACWYGCARIEAGAYDAAGVWGAESPPIRFGVTTVAETDRTACSADGCARSVARGGVANCEACVSPPLLCGVAIGCSAAVAVAALMAGYRLSRVKKVPASSALRALTWAEPVLGLRCSQTQWMLCSIGAPWGHPRTKCLAAAVPRRRNTHHWSAAARWVGQGRGRRIQGGLYSVARAMHRVSSCSIQRHRLAGNGCAPHSLGSHRGRYVRRRPGEVKAPGLAAAGGWSYPPRLRAESSSFRPPAVRTGAGATQPYNSPSLSPTQPPEADRLENCKATGGRHTALQFSLRLTRLENCKVTGGPHSTQHLWGGSRGPVSVSEILPGLFSFHS